MHSLHNQRDSLKVPGGGYDQISSTIIPRTSLHCRHFRSSARHQRPHVCVRVAWQHYVRCGLLLELFVLQHLFYLLEGLNVRAAVITNNRFGCGGLILPARLVQMLKSADELHAAIKIGNGKSAGVKSCLAPESGAIWNLICQFGALARTRQRREITFCLTVSRTAGQAIPALG